LFGRSARSSAQGLTPPALCCDGVLNALDMVAGPPSEAPAVPADVHAEAFSLTQPTAVVIDLPDRRALPQDGSQTVRFGLDGENYEIDLSDGRATELRSALRRYVDAGRRVGQEPEMRIAAGSVRSRPRPGKEQRHDPAAIREWARTHGHHVADRGRIPANVVEAYAAEHRRSRALTTS
jgi:nucleoid-associated protein Lsr2